MHTVNEDLTKVRNSRAVAATERVIGDSRDITPGDLTAGQRLVYADKLRAEADRFSPSAVVDDRKTQVEASHDVSPPVGSCGLHDNCS